MGYDLDLGDQYLFRVIFMIFNVCAHEKNSNQNHFLFLSV